MSHSICYFILVLFFYIAGVSTCKCTTGQGIGTYCGGELFNSGGGSDCGWSDIWSCKFLNGDAVSSANCPFGCCGIPGKNSICCDDSECLKCPYPNQYFPKTKSLNDSSPSGPKNPTTTTQTSGNTSTAHDTSPTSEPKSNNAEIIGSVIGGVAIIVAALIGVFKIRRRRRSQQEPSQQEPSQQRPLIININNSNTNINNNNSNNNNNSDAATTQISGINSINSMGLRR